MLLRSEWQLASTLGMGGFWEICIDFTLSKKSPSLSLDRERTSLRVQGFGQGFLWVAFKEHEVKAQFLLTIGSAMISLNQNPF